MKRRLWHAKEREVGDIKATVKTSAADELNQTENWRGKQEQCLHSQGTTYYKVIQKPLKCLKRRQQGLSKILLSGT